MVIEEFTGEMPSEATIRIEAADLVTWKLISNRKFRGYSITDKGRSRLQGEDWGAKYL